MRNPKDAFNKKQFIRGKDLGKAFLENEVRKRLNLKPFFTPDDKFYLELKLLPSEADKREYNKYVKLLQYLEDRRKMLKIHKIELDRQIAWRVCYLNGIISEAHRLLNEPIVITAKMDDDEATVFDEELNLVRKIIISTHPNKDIGSPKRLKLNPLQERQREINGVALLVRGGEKRQITDRYYDLPSYAVLEQLRKDELKMPDPDFEDIQHRADMIKGILTVFNIIGAEVGLDIPKAYGDEDIENIFHNARAFNGLFGQALAKLTETKIKALPKHLKKYIKMINLDKEAKDRDLEKVSAEIHELKAFDFNTGDGVGDRLETILFN